MQNTANQHRDSGYWATRAVLHWEVIEKAHPYGDQLKKLRLSVTYADGKARVLAPAFSSREDLDKYVERWHPNFAGKERLS